MKTLRRRHATVTNGDCHGGSEESVIREVARRLHPQPTVISAMPLEPQPAEVEGPTELAEIMNAKPAMLDSRTDN